MCAIAVGLVDYWIDRLSLHDAAATDLLPGCFGARLLLGRRGGHAHGPAEPLRADPPPGSGARRAAVRARGPAPGADRGGAPPAPPRRAHARRGAPGQRVGARG